MPNQLPPDPDDERYPTVTLTGFCNLLLARMAEASMNPADEDFEEFAKGLIRLISGWACERGVLVQSLHESVDAGLKDSVEHRDHSEPVEIPVTTETTEH